MPASVGATLLVDENNLPCQIEDLSLGGCKMVFRKVDENVLTRQPRAQLRVEIGDERIDQIFNIRLRTIRTVIDTGETVIGGEFAHADLDEVRAKIRLVIGNKQRWIDFQKKRESKLGVFGALMAFTGLGIKGSLFHLAHLLVHAGQPVAGQTRIIENR
jgi:hypothetical protein